jgi:hypothetical protein
VPRSDQLVSHADKPAEGSVPDALVQLSLDRLRPLALEKDARMIDPQVCLKRVSHLEHCPRPGHAAIEQKQNSFLHSKAATRAT